MILGTPRDPRLRRVGLLLAILALVVGTSLFRLVAPRSGPPVPHDARGAASSGPVRPTAPVTDDARHRSGVDTSAPAAPTSARRDSTWDEAQGGHTLARHVGRTDAQLHDRLRREPNIGAASTWTDRDTAERVIAAALERQAARVRAWSARDGARPNLALDYRGDAVTPLGRSLVRGARNAVPCTDALVVLRWDTRKTRFFVLTAYPEPS